MTANLFGERFIGNREPAWHGLGTVFTEPINAVEAVESSGCDYSVFKAPLLAEIHNTWVEGKPKGNSRVPVDGKYILTRQQTVDDPQFRFFGTVSEEYEVLDNMEIARALDTLTDRWPVETVGALDEGKILFVALDAGEINIGNNGETVHQYFVFTDRKDGKQRARFMFTPVRVVCQNTLVMGERQSRVNAQILHRTGAAQALQLRVDVVDQMLKTQQVSIESLSAMASVEITNAQAMAIISAAYPLPKKSADADYANLEETVKTFGDGELADSLFEIGQKVEKRFGYKHDRAKAHKQFAEMLYETINDEHASIARTPWAAYNAVVEAADYRQGRGDISRSSLFGRRSKEKVLAYNAATRATIKASK